jgi:hypothetical protein
MDDIVSRENPEDPSSNVLFTFTDGVGRCAQNVADQAAKDLGFDDHDVHRHPSAIQFRLVRLAGGQASRDISAAFPNQV